MPIVFVEEPIGTDYFNGENPFASFQKALGEVCSANGVTFVTAQDELHRRRDHFLYHDAVHLTKWGYRLEAQRIFDALQNPAFPWFDREYRPVTSSEAIYRPEERRSGS